MRISVEHQVLTSDSELVQRTLQGDIAAFDVVVRRYERSVLSIAMAFLADWHAAQDVSQETFVAAHRSLHTLSQAEKLGPWLMQIARRTSGKWVAARKRLPVMAPLDEVSSSPSNECLRSQRLLTAIEHLPEQERLVVTMRFFDGHSSQEIADMTGHPVGTVTKQLSRAYERLRQWLAQPEE